MKEEVQMGKGVCMANLFHFLLSCGKASLLPFLAIYFRMLGLSATQVGAIFCVKGLMALWTAPLWTACAKWCNKKKAVLGLSVFFLTGSTVMLAMVPPASPGLPQLFCSRNLNYSSSQMSQLPTWVASHLPGSSVSTPPGVPSNKSEVNHGVLPPGSNGERTSVSPATPTTATITTPSTTITTTASTTTTKSPTSTESLESLINNLIHDYDDQKENGGQDSKHKENNPAYSPSKTPSTISHNKEPINTNTQDGTTSEDVFQLMHELQSMGLSMDKINAFLSMSDEEQKTFMNTLAQNLSPDNDDAKNQGKKRHRTRRLLDVSSYEKQNLNQTGMKSTLEETLDYLMDKCTFCSGMHSTFVFVMALVVIGELFSSPVDKLADDIWFEYLDIVDALDRYGSHRAWASLGLVVAAPVVSIVVDHLPCTLPRGLSSFNVHFFVFVGFMVLSFIIMCAYPVSSNRRTGKKSKLGKGMKVLCGDAHAIVYTFTMLVVAICYAPVVFFLMWQMQDLEGSETVMGLSIAAASFSELLIYPFKGWLIKHILHSGAVSISLLVLVVRYVFYSFMWSPWMAVIGEASQGITLSLLWTTLQTYGDFRCNPHIMDRSAYHVLNALYAFGLVIGAAVSGILYDAFGMPVLLRASAVAMGVWLVVFLAVTMCSKKKEKVRYAALLQDEDDISSDEDNTIYQDDWLEVALSKTNKSNKLK